MAALSRREAARFGGGFAARIGQCGRSGEPAAARRNACGEREGGRGGCGEVCGWPQAPSPWWVKPVARPFAAAGAGKRPSMPRAPWSWLIARHAAARSLGGAPRCPADVRLPGCCTGCLGHWGGLCHRCGSRGLGRLSRDNRHGASMRASTPAPHPCFRAHHLVRRAQAARPAEPRRGLVKLKRTWREVRGHAESSPSAAPPCLRGRDKETRRKCGPSRATEHGASKRRNGHSALNAPLPRQPGRAGALL